MGIVCLAATGERFVSFAPYVPAIDGFGRVVFQATTPDGRSGIYRSPMTKGEVDHSLPPPAPPSSRPEPGQGMGDECLHPSYNGLELTAVLADSGAISHPATNDAGDICFYSLAGLELIHLNERRVLAGAPELQVGPLGPTMAGKRIAFRANDGAYLWDGSDVTCVSEGHSELAGLPVVNGRGQVAFRSAGGIYLWEAGELVTVIALDDEIASLGNFPYLNESGEVSFVASRLDGSSFVGLWRSGEVEVLVEGGSRFESLRGVICLASGELVFFATPVGGKLAVFRSSGEFVIGVGSEVGGSLVDEFALNAVSANARGDIALRVRLVDGVEMIVVSPRKA